MCRCFCSSVGTKTKIWVRSAEFSNLPSELSRMCHTRGLPLPTIFAMALRQSSSTILRTFYTFFVSAAGGGKSSTLTNSTEVSPRLKKPLQSLFSPYCIATENCFEHFMRFRCSFRAFEAKFNANAL